MASNQDTISYGGDLIIFVIPVTGTTKQPIAFGTNATLKITNKLRDVASKDSGQWPARNYGRYDWTASSDHLFALTLTGSTLTGTTSSADVLWGYYTAQQKVNIAFACKTGTSPSWSINSAYKSFTGQAAIESLDIAAKDGDNATYVVNLQGDGQLSFA
jgi:predicted secreted protein